VFRLLLSVLEQTRVDHIWMPITYFALWTTRLMGWLPDLGRCLLCGVSLAGQAAYFHFSSDGLVCGEHRHGGENGSFAVSLTPDSQMLAVRIFRSPVSAFAGEAWPRSRGADLRRFAIQSLERHLERKLRTAAALSRLGGG
jgi:DNA repair protein RecO (recombination protein O)